MTRRRVTIEILGDENIRKYGGAFFSREYKYNRHREGDMADSAMLHDILTVFDPGEEYCVTFTTVDTALNFNRNYGKMDIVSAYPEEMRN